MVRAAYGDEALTRSDIFRLYGRFHEGREDVQNDPRSGRPSESRADGNIENVRQLLLQNRHLSLRMIADETDISEDTIQKIVVEDLKKNRVCARFVPHALTAEQENRVDACQDLTELAGSDPEFFNL